MSNGDITAIIQSLGNIEEQVFVSLSMGALETAVPFFAIPVISQITAFLISKFIDFVVNKLDIATIDLVTIISTADQENAFVKAAQANALAVQSGDQNAINQAQANVITAARFFFKLTPV